MTKKFFRKKENSFDLKRNLRQPFLHHCQSLYKTFLPIPKNCNSVFLTEKSSETEFLFVFQPLPCFFKICEHNISAISKIFRLGEKIWAITIWENDICIERVQECVRVQMCAHGCAWASMCLCASMSESKGPCQHIFTLLKTPFNTELEEKKSFQKPDFKL